MARSKGSSAKDLAEWQRLNRLAREHGWPEEDEEPSHRIYFVEGTKEQLRSMGFSLADLDAEEVTDDEQEAEPESDKDSESEDSATSETESEESEPEREPETDSKPEPKPRSRNRYFGGR